MHTLSSDFGMTAILARFLTVVHIVSVLLALLGVIVVWAVIPSAFEWAAALKILAVLGVWFILSDKLFAFLSDQLSKNPIKTALCFVWADLHAVVFFVFAALNKPNPEFAGLLLISAAAPILVLLGGAALLRWVVRGNAH